LVGAVDPEGLMSSLHLVSPDLIYFMSQLRGDIYEIGGCDMHAVFAVFVGTYKHADPRLIVLFPSIKSFFPSVFLV
jgi:hypothetical protein